MAERHLASIRKINSIVPIEGADAIELVKIDGWQCVAKVGEFKIGDWCVYCEIDSYLPVCDEFEFLRKSSFKRMGEAEGFRIKTIKLRGQLSQGLALPMSIAFEKFQCSKYDEGQELSEFFHLGQDLTEFFGIQKYEAPIPVEIAGKVSGNFPSFIKKTDQERCQNISDDIFKENADAEYEVTMKMDGTSFTAFYVDGEEGVCGRNWELKLDGSNDGNALVRMYIDSGCIVQIKAKLCSTRRTYGPCYTTEPRVAKSYKIVCF